MGGAASNCQQADDVTRSGTHVHAHEVGDRGTGLLEDLADGLRGVTGEGLVDEAVVLEEGVQATLNNLGNDVGGLTFLERDLFEGSALLVEHVGGNRVAVEVGGM